MQKLIELHLERQKTPMTTLTYDAWSGIGKSLEYLYINDNALTAFPHPLLGEEDYPNLREIYAQKYGIRNMTEFEVKAFQLAKWLHQRKYKEFVPFSTYPNLEILYVEKL